jgi:hypothetical protein
MSNALPSGETTESESPLAEKAAEGKVDEDMTRMDTNIIRTYLGRDMDDEYVICLCTTIRAKDKVSLFLCYLFTYFENRLLSKNIIIIRNHGDDDGVLKDRHGGGEDQQGTSNPS